MRNLKRLAMAGSMLAALAAVGGCSLAQQEQILSDIKTACILLPVGTTFIVNFSSSIPLALNIAPIVQTIGTAAENDCEALVTAVQAVINQINSSGATATVTVSTSSANPAAVKKLAAKLMAKYPGAYMKALPGSKGVTFVVPPSFFHF